MILKSAEYPAIDNDGGSFLDVGNNSIRCFTERREVEEKSGEYQLAARRLSCRIKMMTERAIFFRGRFEIDALQPSG